jgi:hypothetical protein
VRGVFHNLLVVSDRLFVVSLLTYLLPLSKTGYEVHGPLVHKAKPQKVLHIEFLDYKWLQFNG